MRIPIRGVWQEKIADSRTCVLCGGMAKERADQLLTAHGLAESREQARRLIMAGLVWRRDQKQQPLRVDKPGTLLPEDTLFEIKGQEQYVSRGAYKLLTGLVAFNVDVRGMTALDAGASTGGFADCLLQRGAAKVYAVDVGHGQLHEKLRADPRVINLERTNLRNAGPELIPEMVDIVAADVSFISLTLILPPCIALLKPEGLAFGLIKPQFELGPKAAPKGVVRCEAAQRRAVDTVLAFAREKLALEHVGVVPASVRGPKGNQEYLSLWRKAP